MIRPVLGDELGANASYIASSPLHSLATNRALIPFFLWSMCPGVITRFFPRATCRSTVSHSANTSSRQCVATRFFPRALGGSQSRTLQTLRVGQALSAWPPSPLPFPRCQQAGPATLLRLRGQRSTPHGPRPRFQISRFQPLLNFKTSIFGSSSRGRFACEGTSSVINPAARFVGVDDLE